MTLEQLVGRYMRLRSELSNAYEARTPNTEHVNRLSDEIAATERIIAQVQPADEQTSDLLLGFPFGFPIAKTRRLTLTTYWSQTQLHYQADVQVRSRRRHHGREFLASTDRLPPSAQEGGCGVPHPPSALALSPWGARRQSVQRG